MEFFSWLALLAVVLTPLLVGLLGLTKLVWRVVIHYQEPILGFLAFLSANLAFTAFMVATTGVSLELKAMPWIVKIQFLLTFVLLYVLGNKLSDIRSELSKRKDGQRK